MNILKELAAALPSDAGPSGFKPKTFRWSLDLDQHGVPTHPSLIDLADPNDPNRKKGISHDAPNMSRTVNVAPFLGADNLKYVLGWCAKDPDPAPHKTLACQRAFAAAVAKWHDRFPEDPAGVALHAFYTNSHHLAVSNPTGKWVNGDNVLLSLHGVPVFHSPTLRAVWVQTVTAQKTGGGISTCIVCGKVGSTLDTLPTNIPPGRLPRSDNGVAVISVNKSLFGHTQEMQLSSSPICESCGEAVVKNLNTMIGLSHGRGAGTNATAGAFQVNGMKTKFIWWVSPKVTLSLDPIDHPSPDVVAELLNRVENKPRTASSNEEGMFYGLSLAANGSRLIFSDSMSEPVADVERHLASWFTDMKVAAQWPDDAEVFPLWRLVQTFGIFDGEKYSSLKPIDIKEAHDPHRPPRAHQHLLRAALTGCTIPAMYLHHLIARITADHGLRDDRIAALKLCLARYPHQNQEATVPTPGLDPTNNHPAYLSGQLLALLANIQQVAYDPTYKTTVNATFISKYLSGAIGNPARAIVSGREQGEAWLKKARRDSPAAGLRLSNALDELFDKFTASDGLPERLVTADQALVILGYHHYKSDSRRKGLAGAAAKKTVETNSTQPGMPITDDNGANDLAAIG